MSRSTATRLTLAIAIVLAACSSDPASPPQPPTGEFTVLDNTLWPGESVRITSEDFETWGDDATLEIGDATVPMSRVDATTLEATLPSMLAGSVVPVLNFDGHSYDIDAITVAGFKRVDLPTDSPVVWDAYLTMIGGVPYAFGGAPGGDLAVINLQAATVSTYPIFDYETLRGPGVTWQDENWVFRSDGGYELWDMSGAPSKVRDLPEAPLGVADRQVAWLSENVWLSTTGNAWTILTRPDDQTPFVESETAPALISEPEGIHLSPAGDRAVMRVDRILGGVPVFDAVMGEVAYVTDFTTVQGVDFSPDGSLLAMVGGRGGGPEDATSRHVELFDAVTGEVGASAELVDPPFAVHIDPAGDRVYVAISSGSATGSRPAVLVLDADDLSQIARLEPLATTPTCAFNGAFNCLGGVITRHGDEVIIYYGWNGPPRIWKYALLP